MNICEPCGFMSEHDGHFAKHLGSVCHRKIRLIRAMLEKNCIQYTEIGRRVGVSRERIRQLAVRIGLDTGLERMKQCTLDSRPPVSLSEFFQRCAARGLTVLPVSKSRREAIVNGKFCLERRACEHDLTIRRGEWSWTRRVWHVAAPQIEFEVCAWLLPNGKYLILPRELVGFKSTGFMPEENNGNRKGAYSANHYYRDYIERWDVFNQGASGDCRKYR